MNNDNTQIDDIAGFLKHCHLRNFKPKSTIIHTGDTGKSLYYMVSGSAAVTVEDEDGHDIIVAYLNPGEFFGEMALFGEHEPRSAWVRSKSACEIAEISYSRFNQLIKQQPSLMFALATQMAKRLRNTTQKVKDLAFLDVTGRIARTLLSLSREPAAMTHPDGIQIKFTRQELAKIVGCTREVAGRVLKNLEEQGLISSKGQNIVIFSDSTQAMSQ